MKNKKVLLIFNSQVRFVGFVVVCFFFLTESFQLFVVAVQPTAWKAICGIAVLLCCVQFWSGTYQCCSENDFVSGCCSRCCYKHCSSKSSNNAEVTSSLSCFAFFSQAYSFALIAFLLQCMSFMCTKVQMTTECQMPMEIE